MQVSSSPIRDWGPILVKLLLMHWYLVSQPVLSNRKPHGPQSVTPLAAITNADHKLLNPQNNPPAVSHCLWCHA